MQRSHDRLGGQIDMGDDGTPIFCYNAAMRTGKCTAMWAYNRRRRDVRGLQNF
jgi:hypothetical protein